MPLPGEDTMPTLNYELSTRNEIADIISGMRVDRAAAVIANGTNTLFNIVGGRVLITGFLGEVVTDMDASLTTIRASALTTDATAVITYLSGATGTLASKTASVMITLPAAVASDMTISTGTSAALFNAAPLYVVKTGAFNMVAGAANAGTAKWSIWYIPLDDGAYVTAA